MESIMLFVYFVFTTICIDQSYRRDVSDVPVYLDCDENSGLPQTGTCQYFCKILFSSVLNLWNLYFYALCFLIDIMKVQISTEQEDLDVVVE